MANLDKLLAKAQTAYQNGDKRLGAQLVDQILRQELKHQGTWEMLYRLYGAGQSLGEFQRSFVKTYYPKKLAKFTTGDEIETPVSDSSPVQEFRQAEALEKKPSLIQRILGLFKRSPKPAASPADEQLAASAPITDTPAPQNISAPEMRPPREPRPAAAPVERPVEPIVPAEEPRQAAPSLLQSAAMRSAPPAPPASSYRPDAPIPTPGPGKDKIRVVVVDDINQTRENVIRSLRFYQDLFDVVGTATNGEQGIQVARETRPDVILMDVNMPGMDGITATANIKRELPATEVIILTVQDDVDYMRGAMAAGARDFLAKPPMIDELLQAVQRAGAHALETRARQAAEQAKVVQQQTIFAPGSTSGRVISVYSPRGGSGCTMLAVNLAAALHSEETPVVVVDGNLQFGDIPVFFNVQSKNTILELAPRAGELDDRVVDEVLGQHSSGIRLLAPPHQPHEAEMVDGLQFSQVIQYLSQLYSYVIVDTMHRLSDITLAVLDVSDLVVLIVPQDIPAISRLRKFLDLAPALKLDPQRMLPVMNPYDSRIGITPEKINQALKISIATTIPVEIATALQSINRGNPFVLQKDAQSRPITRAINDLAALVRQKITELDQAPEEEENGKKPAKKR